MLKRWLVFAAQREDQVFLALTLVIGALVGLAVVAFIVLTERLGMRLYPVGSDAWRRVLIPIAGSLAMGYLLARYFPDARGSGVPQTKAALFAREGYISLRTVIGKFVCTAATLASGIPLGREGPSVQVGAGIASVLGRRLGLRPEKVKALLPVGAAAAVAAAFNTPMAAVLFSLEEVMGDLNAPILGSVVLASATSWAILRMLLGNNPLFHVPQYELVHPGEFAIYAVLGVAGGFLSAAFTKTFVRHAHALFAAAKKDSMVPSSGRRCAGWTHGLVCATGAGSWLQLCGRCVEQSYGFKVDGASGGAQAFWRDPELRFRQRRWNFWSCTVSWRNAWRNNWQRGPSFFPTSTALPGAYALVGMGALFAGIVRAPMTSVLMIFEMTHDYAVIVPLMIANLASLFISSRLQKQPIYEALAHQDGIHLPDSKSRSGFGQRKVFQAMRNATETLTAQSTRARGR